MALRICPVNFFDEATSLVATSEASASLVAANMQSNVRSDVWRSTNLNAAFAFASVRGSRVAR